MCSSLKFKSDASHLNLLYFCVLNLYLLGIQPPFTIFVIFNFFSSDNLVPRAFCHYWDGDLSLLGQRRYYWTLLLDVILRHFVIVGTETDGDVCHYRLRPNDNETKGPGDEVAVVSHLKCRATLTVWLCI